MPLKMLFSELQNEIKDSLITKKKLGEVCQVTLVHVLVLT